MLTIEIGIDELTAAMCALEVIPNRTPLQETALQTLRDAYDNAAEEYWTQVWSY